MIESLKSRSNRPTTLSNYHTIWNLFNSFLIRLDEMPNTWEERLCLYVGYCADRGLQSSMIKSYISGIKHMLSMDDYYLNENKILLTTLTRATKLENDSIRNRLPIQKGLLELMLFEVETSFSSQYYLELLFKTLFIIGYYGMMRIGELVKTRHAIMAKDIHLSYNKKKLLLVLRSSKTHGKGSKPQTIKISGLQTIQRHHRITSRSKKGRNFFCPFDITNEYLQIRGDYESIDEHLFIFQDGSQIQPG